jgi:hypothetical protein
VISEKSTVKGTIAPVLDEYGVTFRSWHGYVSATKAHELAEEIPDSIGLSGKQPGLIG